jgi:cytidylate kinase
MGVVTISRQYGAGGLRVAPVVASALGYRVVDREIAEETARRIGLDPGVVSSLDERAPAIVEELGLVLTAAPPFGMGPVAEPQVAAALDDRALAETTRAVIVSLGDAGGYVIVGRGGQAALGDRPDACHLALVADLAFRVHRVMEWQGVDEARAKALCARVDADRASYVRKYYGVDLADPLRYDAMLDTSRLGIDAAARVAAEVARRKLGAASDPSAQRS